MLSDISNIQLLCLCIAPAVGRWRFKRWRASKCAGTIGATAQAPARAELTKFQRIVRAQLCAPQTFWPPNCALAVRRLPQFESRLAPAGPTSHKSQVGRLLVSFLINFRQLVAPSVSVRGPRVRPMR